MTEPAPVESRRDRLAARSGGSLRALTAGGMLINATFSIGLQGLALVRGFIVAAFIAPSEYGIWSLIVIGYTTLSLLKQVGIVDKYIQQDDPDEELAFQKAFTLEVILTGGFWLLLMAATPLIAIAYQAPEMIAPGLVTIAAMPASVLQTPIWAFQREMDFKRQRLYGSVDPLVAMIVTIALAISGAGYWAFAIGSVAGAWAGAAVIVPRSPYKLRLRYDRGTARQYLSFSKPLFFSNLSSMMLLQGVTLSARSTVGIAGIGALALANSVRNYAAFADGIVSSTMYPAVCAVKDRTDLMYESFVKSNRLALMWGFPVGIGTALFADDLVQFLLGSQWEYATVLFVAVGVSSAFGHVAFNWESYIRATGDTGPIAKYAWIGLGGWAVGPIPLLFIDGLRGYAIGLLIVTAVNLVTRGYFMRRMFPAFSIVPHGLRAMAPTVPAMLLVLGLRALDSGPRSLPLAFMELSVFVLAVAAVTWVAERALLTEAFGYLRKARAAQPMTAG